VSVEAVELAASRGDTGTAGRATEAYGRDSGDGAPYEPVWLPTLFDLDDLLDVLDIRLGTSPVVLRCLDSAHGGILGAQLLAQQVVLAERLAPGKRVRTLHTLFTRPGRNDRVLEAGVERLYDGQPSAALALTFRQDGEVVSRAQVLLSGDDPDVTHNDAAHNDVTHNDVTHNGRGPLGFAPPDESRRVHRALIPWDARDVRGSHSRDIDLWLRAPSLVGEDSTLWSALLAHASVVPALEQLAEGGESGGPRAPEAAIFSHCLTLAVPVDVREWHLLQASSRLAGGAQAALCRGEFRGPGDGLGAYFETSGLPRQPEQAT
jgi:acyl-CoA thioesterase